MMFVVALKSTGSCCRKVPAPKRMSARRTIKYWYVFQIFENDKGELIWGEMIVDEIELVTPQVWVHYCTNLRNSFCGSLEKKRVTPHEAEVMTGFRRTGRKDTPAFDRLRELIHSTSPMG